MLISTRKPGQELKIDLREDVDLEMPVGCCLSRNLSR